MQAQEIIVDVQSILNDSGVTYPEPEIISFINDAQKTICIHRADACSSTRAFPLVAGTKQSIPSDSRRLAGLINNRGADGSLQGSAIRINAAMDDLDSFDPDWHSDIGVEVESYFYDERFPKTFHIYPPVNTPHYVEARLLDIPKTITSPVDNISIEDIYSPCIVSWVVYRLLSKDSDNSPNVIRAAEHKDLFFSILGIKSQSDAQASPKRGAA